MKGDVLLFISFAFISWFQYFKVRGSHHETCDREYTKVGCVHTYQNRKRIYNELIITDRDSRSPKSSDIPTDWFHWEEYLLGLACRCVEKLNKISNGNLSLFHQFTIENYGECWSSRFGHDALHSLTKSNNCIGAGFLECQQNRPGECTGIKLSSFLYQIHNRTKLLDEHCHIVKRIVCPSSTIQWNSSLPPQSPMTDQTTFINSTRTQQYTASQVQISPSTTTLNQTISRENDSSIRVLQSSEIHKITSKEHFITSSKVMQDSTLQYTNPQISLKSVKASFQGSRTVFNQTDSMLSRRQTLNTGLLYTSGSRISNIILAPTQFFITSSMRNATTATDFSVVESNIENHSSDNGPIKSSQTHALITPSTAEKITNIRYITRSSTEVETHTSRLNAVVSSINTNPIENISTYTSQSSSQPDFSTLESNNQTPPAISSSTSMTSRSSWQRNETWLSSPTQKTDHVISKLPSKSYQLNIYNSTAIREPRPVLSTDLSNIQNNSKSDAFNGPWTTLSTGLFNISNKMATSSFQDLPTFSAVGGSSLIQNTTIPLSGVKPPLQEYSHASSSSSLSSFSDKDSSYNLKKETNYSSMKQLEKTQTFTVPTSLPIEEPTSTVTSRISKANEITSSRGITRESHTSIRHISTYSMNTGKITSHNPQSQNSLSSITQSALTTQSTTSKSKCWKFICKGNSARSQQCKTMVILIMQFMFILLA